MTTYSLLPAITCVDAAPFVGMTCRCGCGQIATYLTLCPEIGQTEATFEACCGQARDYLSEACAEMELPFRSRTLGQQPANDRDLS